MSDTTSNLSLPYLAAAQAQKHVTVNDSLRALDAIVQLSVLDRDLTTPPASPADGDRYIVGASATGAWAGKDGQITAWQDGAWGYYEPKTGWRAWVVDEGVGLVHDGNVWSVGLAISSNLATISLHVIEEEVTCSGASVDTTMQIPDRAIVFAVSTRTTQGLTGATSYDCGISGDTGKYGGTLGISAGSTNSGVTGPTAYFANTAVRLTANGANFTGGKVRVAIQYMACGVPAS
ncbi:MAG: DUF2793 domain-containing protein [Hyphomicrobiales bacterium]